jgi:hypothetical protein
MYLAFNEKVRFKGGNDEWLVVRTEGEMVILFNGYVTTATPIDTVEKVRGKPPVPARSGLQLIYGRLV